MRIYRFSESFNIFVTALNFFSINSHRIWSSFGIEPVDSYTILFSFRDIFENYRYNTCGFGCVLMILIIKVFILLNGPNDR